ncbi:MAG: hypothetical protein ACKVVT_12530 [Dehalococcoidia bacterium]
MDPRDEFMHPVGEDRAWSESYYFNFYDGETGVGMFARMGFRANDGTVDGLCGIYLGGRHVAFIYARERLPEPYDTLRAGGLSLERREPFKRWGVKYSGPAQDIADDRVLITRRKERPADWFTPAHAEMDLTFEALNDPYYTPGSGLHGHFEQVGRVHGVVSVGDSRVAVDGFGVRDKSWGPRTWQAGNRPAGEQPKQAPVEDDATPRPFMHWFSLNFGPDLAIGSSCGRRGDEMRGGGWVWRDGQNFVLEDVLVTSTYDPGTILHDSLVLTGKDSGGKEHRVEGKLITVTATKIPMPGGGATFVNEGLARFETGGKVGYGIAEYWHSVKVDE